MPHQRPLDPIFGRDADLDLLCERAARKGLTAVVGRPQSGKSHLLRHVRQRLGEEGGFLVGYWESTGARDDMLLRALSDLYVRWLEDATKRDQLRFLREKLRGRSGEAVFAVGGVLADLAKVAEPTGIASRLIGKAFTGLASANEELRTGGLVLAPLPYDVALELLSVLHELAERPALLILDAFEQSPAMAEEAARLDALLRNLRDWPEAHVLVGCRNEPRDAEAIRRVRDFERSSAAATVHELAPLDLDDAATREPLLSYVRGEVPAAREAADGRLAALIDGHAGVFDRWRQAAPYTEEDLESIAAQAQSYRYEALRGAMEAFAREAGDEARLTGLVALLPEITTEDQWELLEPVVVEGLDPALLPRLQSRGVFDPSQRFPRFGHTTAHEAARRFWLEDGAGRPHSLRLAPELLVSLADAMGRHEAEREWTLLSAFLDVWDPAHDLPGEMLGLLSCVTSRLGIFFPNARDELARHASYWSEKGRALRLLARGLFNTLNDAKEEGDLSARDGLLAELRSLSDAHPEEAVVRERLADGIYNKLFYAMDEGIQDQCDRLLEELRALWSLDRDEAGVRETLRRAIELTIERADVDSPLVRELRQELASLGAAEEASRG